VSELSNCRSDHDKGEMGKWKGVGDYWILGYFQIWLDCSWYEKIIIFIIDIVGCLSQDYDEIRTCVRYWNMCTICSWIFNFWSWLD